MMDALKRYNRLRNKEVTPYFVKGWAPGKEKKNLK